MNRSDFLKYMAMLPLAGETMKLKSLEKLTEAFSKTEKLPVLFSSHGNPMDMMADFRGCTGEDGTIVRQRCPITVEFPNAFSPNGDGLNDAFKAVGEYITGIDMAIYNTWGEEVFRSHDPNIGWDGTFKGRQAPVGIYIYRSTIEGYGKNKHLLRYYRKGTLSLIR